MASEKPRLVHVRALKPLVVNGVEYGEDDVFLVDAETARELGAAGDVVVYNEH